MREDVQNRVVKSERRYKSAYGRREKIKKTLPYLSGNVYG
jgi:hypothetical protein